MTGCPLVKIKYKVELWAKCMHAIRHSTFNAHHDCAFKEQKTNRDPDHHFWESNAAQKQNANWQTENNNNRKKYGLSVLWSFPFLSFFLRTKWKQNYYLICWSSRLQFMSTQNDDDNGYGLYSVVPMGLKKKAPIISRILSTTQKCK